MLNQQQRYFLAFHSIEVVHIHNMAQDMYEVQMSELEVEAAQAKNTGEPVMCSWVGSVRQAPGAS